MASYTPPTPNITSQLNGTYYGLVYLGLATLAYASEHVAADISIAVNAILNNPQKFPPIPDPTNGGAPMNGYWKLDWGVAVGDNSNAIFVVSFRQGSGPTNGVDGNPYFFAVVNRGTDTSAWWGGVEQQLVQDLGSFSQTAWTTVLQNMQNPLQNPCKRAVPTASLGLIADGTRDAVMKVTGFTSSWQGTNYTVAGVMNQLLALYPGTPTVVTGHSLGGCLTQVVAAYLAWQLYNTQSPTDTAPLILSNPFAPPTAGDPTFATVYSTLFPNSNFWFNTADLIPCAWANLKQVPSLWHSYTWPSNPPGGKGPDIPLWLYATVFMGKGSVPPYSRPSNNIQTLQGSLPDLATMTNFLTKMGSSLDPTSWDAQLLWQHFPPCYWGEITTQMKTTVQYYPYVDTQPPY